MIQNLVVAEEGGNVLQVKNKSERLWKKGCAKFNFMNFVPVFCFCKCD